MSDFHIHWDQSGYVCDIQEVNLNLHTLQTNSNKLQYIYTHQRASELGTLAQISTTVHLFLGAWTYLDRPSTECKCKRVDKSNYNLADIHAGVTAEGPDCSQVIGLYQSGDNAILIHFSYHGSIHKVHQAILIQCNTCMKEPTVKKLNTCAW